MKTAINDKNRHSLGVKTIIEIKEEEKCSSYKTHPPSLFTTLIHSSTLNQASIYLDYDRLTLKAQFVRIGVSSLKNSLPRCRCFSLVSYCCSPLAAHFHRFLSFLNCPPLLVVRSPSLSVPNSNYSSRFLAIERAQLSLFLTRAVPIAHANSQKISWPIGGER
jgi:hypothetical protein